MVKKKTPAKGTKKSQSPAQYEFATDLFTFEKVIKPKNDGFLDEDDIVEETKTATIFDVLKYITYIKCEWKDVPDYVKNAWNTFMIHKYISMKADFLEIVNEYQSIELTKELEPITLYTLYASIIPKDNYYFKYIKAADADKFNPELISMMINYYECSSIESEKYLYIYYKDESNLDKLVDILRKYGKDDKEITKLLTTK